MRSLAALAQARTEDSELEPDEVEALGRFALLSDLRPSWTPMILEPLLTTRCSPAAALLAASVTSEHQEVARQSWSLWARPWGLRGLSSSEVWFDTMRECFEAGLLIGELPARMVDRSASVARLGPRLVGMLESGAKRVRVVL